jgi:hypothetical protein
MKVVRLGIKVKTVPSIETVAVAKKEFLSSQKNSLLSS